MKDTLAVGLKCKQNLKVPKEKTVPMLYPESEEFRAMPEVFATGYMIGFIEWTCIQAINPYLDWPVEQSLGTHVNLSHEAATPPGNTVTAQVEIIELDRKRIVFSVEVHDEVEVISRGIHERIVVNRGRFEDGLLRKRK